MSGHYASDTSVSVDRSRAQIEQVLQRYGAHGFAYAWEGATATVGFRVTDADGTRLTIRMTLPLPDPNNDEFRLTPSGKRERSDDQRVRSWEQACRSRWRAMLLVIKAKLEAVEVGISTIEREFMPDVLLPGGDTIGEQVSKQRAMLAEGGKLRLLEMGGSS